MFFSGLESVYFADENLMEEDRVYMRNASVNIAGTTADTISWSSNLNSTIPLDTSQVLGATSNTGIVQYFTLSNPADPTQDLRAFTSYSKTISGQTYTASINGDSIISSAPLAIRLYAASPGSNDYAPASNNFNIYKDIFIGGSLSGFDHFIDGITVNGVDPSDPVVFTDETNSTLTFPKSYSIGDLVHIKAIFDSGKYSFKSWEIPTASLPKSSVDQSSLELTFRVGKPSGKPSFNVETHTSITLNIEKN
jgi:hypothetical protein